ncbi:MAG: hypothetical protein LOY01_03155 [Brachybacterium paraconglomeratum]|nr:hypothetical protein [Brachybacterium paraconglomeratum]
MSTDETAVRDTAEATPPGGPRARNDRPGRRHLLRGANWAAPALAVSVAAPAVAASPHDIAYGINFDGGGAANGYFNSAYLNLGWATGTQPAGTVLTLTEPLVLIIDVVGLNTAARDERSMEFGSSDGAIVRRTYNQATRTTTLVWTIPVGRRIPVNGTAPANPDVLFTFRDGASSTSGAGRITDKIVVRSVTGCRITEALSTNGPIPANLPIGSSVVKDYDRRAVSPDGIY